ncbi:MAG: hypothetical protein ACK2TV_00160 [Anaerolineales bacterium]|jgi:hypothetical protein
MNLKVNLQNLYPFLVIILAMATGFALFLITEKIIFLIVFITIGLTLGISLGFKDRLDQ